MCRWIALALISLAISACSTPSGPARTATLTVFEGLPSPHGEAELLAKEAASKETQRLDGEPFYVAPLTVQPADLATLRAALGDGALYRSYTASKKCGGFHADYAVRWDQTLVLLCFGCSEVRRVDGARTAMYDMDSDIRARLRALLDAIPGQRPR